MNPRMVMYYVKSETPVETGACVQLLTVDLFG